jgi:hypothetical protein
MYFKETENCSIAEDYIDRSKATLKWSKDKELIEVHKAIEDVLINVSMNKITIEHGAIPEAERETLIKLNEKRKALKQSKELEKIWNK